MFPNVYCLEHGEEFSMALDRIWAVCKSQGVTPTALAMPTFTWLDYVGEVCPNARNLCSITSIKHRGIPVHRATARDPYASEGRIYFAAQKVLVAD